MWLFKHVLNKKVFVSLYERKMVYSKHCMFTWDSCQTRDPVPSLSCNVSSQAVSDNVKLISSLFVVALHDTTRQQQIHTYSFLFGHCMYSRWEYPLVGNSERLWLNILCNTLCDVFSINQYCSGHNSFYCNALHTKQAGNNWRAWLAWVPDCFFHFLFIKILKTPQQLQWQHLACPLCINEK